MVASLGLPYRFGGNPDRSRGLARSFQLPWEIASVAEGCGFRDLAWHRAIQVHLQRVLPQSRELPSSIPRRCLHVHREVPVAQRGVIHLPQYDAAVIVDRAVVAKGIIDEIEDSSAVDRSVQPGTMLD